MRSVSTTTTSKQTIRAALAALLVTASMVGIASSAYAEDMDTRMKRLERDVQTLSQAVYKGKMPPASVTASSANGSEYQANVETRLSDIENQIRDLTGQVERQTYETQQLKTQLDRALADINLRLGGLEKSGASATQQSQNSGAYVVSGTQQNGTLMVGDMGGPVHGENGNNNAAAPNGGTVRNLGILTESPGGASVPRNIGEDPAGQYETAFALMKNGSFESSRKAFETFVAQNPSHPLTANATYWIGENFYAEGNYNKAVRAFAESYKKYPHGPKGADSLLKMGMSLGKVGKNQQACVTFEQLKKEYKVGEAGILRRASEEGAKLGCAN